MEPTSSQSILLRILSEKTDSNLEVSATITPPSPHSDLLWTTFVDPDKKTLLATWADSDAFETVIYDAPSYLPIHKLPGFRLTPTWCVNSDRKALFVAVGGYSRTVETLDLKTFKTSIFSYDSVGETKSFYKAPVASDECSIVIVQRSTRYVDRNSPAMIYIYDMSSRLIKSQFQIKGDGYYVFDDHRHLLIIDETIIVPNRLPSGEVVGNALVKTGNLLIYDAISGMRLTSINVPLEGHIQTISRETGVLSYLSPGKLTTIDLNTKKLARSANLSISDPLPEGAR